MVTVPRIILMTKPRVDNVDDRTENNRNEDNADDRTW